MDFYKRINLVCKMIPEGHVATYGQIATLCGRPKNSRQVGFALRTGKAGEDIPAHRIISSTGRLTGADYFGGPDVQKELLENEGVRLSHDGKYWKVNLKEYIWKSGADALVFGEDMNKE